MWSLVDRCFSRSTRRKHDESQIQSGEKRPRHRNFGDNEGQQLSRVRAL